MRVLVTGAGGFIGSHFCKFLLDKGHEVYAAYYKSDERLEPLKKDIDAIKCDVADPKQASAAIHQSKPDRIMHLAAQSFPTVSWERPADTIRSNVIGTVNVFETVKKEFPDTFVLVACSSAEYGFVSPEKMPMREDYPLLPLHPYGVSKVAQDLLAYQYFTNFKIKTVRARIFNTTGPGKTDDVCADFSKGIVEIEKGKRDKLLVGNLDPIRNITDARDMVDALWTVSEKGRAGDVYNISSGKSYAVKDLLQMLIERSTTDIKVEQDPAKMRPTDEPIIAADNSKLVKATGWQPKIPIEKTLEDMLEYWRGRL